MAAGQGPVAADFRPDGPKLARAEYSSGTMPDPDLVAGKHVVEDFAHRLDAHIHDLVVHGGFTDIYRNLDDAMRRRADADPHPAVTIIVTEMLMQFLSYHDMETVRHKIHEHAQFPRGY
jgi:hypothetical protein